MDKLQSVHKAFSERNAKREELEHAIKDIAAVWGGKPNRQLELESAPMGYSTTVQNSKESKAQTWVRWGITSVAAFGVASILKMLLFSRHPQAVFGPATNPSTSQQSLNHSIGYSTLLSTLQATLVGAIAAKVKEHVPSLLDQAVSYARNSLAK